MTISFINAIATLRHWLSKAGVQHGVKITFEFETGRDRFRAECELMQETGPSQHVTISEDNRTIKSVCGIDVEFKGPPDGR